MVHFPTGLALGTVVGVARGRYRRRRDHRPNATAAPVKVRWTPAHIRLRITPAELDAIGRHEAFESEIAFSGGAWTLRLDPAGGTLGAAWVDGVVVVTLGETGRNRMLERDVEGVYQEDGPSPRVSVEKDFPCAHPHPDEAGEPVTERFVPTPSYRARKGLKDG